MNVVYEKVMAYKRKYPGGITWHRLRKHSEVVEKHLNEDEIVLYAFAGQKNDSAMDFFQTCVVALTNKRILIGQKRTTWGYYLSSITPDLFNDMQLVAGLFWGKVTIDTVKETIVISNLAKSSLPEIESNISEFMMEEKKKYQQATDDSKA